MAPWDDADDDPDDDESDLDALRAAAEDGDPDAQYEYGCALIDLAETAVDRSIARGWLLRAARHRVEDAWFELAASRPDLARLLAFSTRLVLVDGDGVLEITPAAE